MRWVKLTFPPRPRRRWLLMTTRLSMSSLAGTARTLVAVGTARLASMLTTVRAAAPLSTRPLGADAAGSGEVAVGSVDLGSADLVDLVDLAGFSGFVVASAVGSLLGSAGAVSAGAEPPPFLCASL